LRGYRRDLDLPNDLLDVFEEGVYRITELARLRDETADIKDDDGNTVTLKRGLLRCLQFPFVILTSNGEREFPAPFLRRCLQLDLPEPNAAQLADIVKAHFDGQLSKEAESLIEDFISRQDSATLATDQLLNAVFLIAGRNFGSDETRTEMIDAVLRSLQRG
jgi:MoxR-like ATPase